MRSSGKAGCRAWQVLVSVQRVRQPQLDAHTGLLQAVKRLLRNCASRDVTLFEVPDGYHELFMGPERDKVTKRLAAWILEHAALKSGQPS